ncbi:TPA: hypothetical protein RQJ91_000668 [Vibrio vulnificus]|nr:hypothetical protein [Vibrio vulnificus]
MFTSPDFSRFIKRIGTNDLARSNLFLVRFGDFRSLLTNDGIISAFTDAINSGQGTSNLEPSIGADYTWNLAQRGVANTAYKMLPNSAKKILGASDELGVFSDLFGSGMNDILDGNYRINEDFAMMVKSVNLPSKSFDVNTLKIDRKPFAEVRNATTGNLTMTVYCSPDFIERRLMLMWMNAIHDEHRNVFGFQHSYSREINVVNLDRNGVASAVTICKGCFPIRVSEVQLDFDSDNQVATFEVEFYVSTQRQVNTLLHSTIKGF